ncbi:head maturation protease, ClpP-related [Asticcacaulis excentricus]|uniref:ATP-dependent Clp protease proteolytic subunit n=1 Tax=Asticcacaulis excentricus (strain ATCC 15261 / DSM 4724 / KCTC 12464 / NCIMB 9791 / VKM B-1370 / CB 48) TaxID=573065 RepID=E8RPQ1_ASTEC|nr:head maturation protease, ClpP-related [Asticcacaulis excentricus]ADU12028.1 peptidase S14 ClpP [Asticcacaulis excentricus CB 48]
MSLRKLPQVKAFNRPDHYDWDVPSDVLAKWTPQAAENEGDATISIYDYIGYDYWDGGGFTAARAAAALRSIGPNPVEVRINSGGGDMFEGLAIYNLFREHPAKVTVKVMGMAASAASIIAMSADELVMATGSFLMIHNAWGVVVGNRNEMRAAAETFDEFDLAMAEIYQHRSNIDLADIQAMMDKETWLRASEAVKQGFADGTTDDPAPSEANARAQLNARQRLDHILSDAKMPRSERRRLLREATGTQDAAAATTRNAGDDLDAAMSALLASI